jgi:microcystin degradation protein MlrC
MKIAFIEFQQETNSFSTVKTTLKDFKNFHLYLGQEIIEQAKSSKFQLGGFMKAIKKYGEGKIEVLPIVCGWANSGGPLTVECFDYFKELVGKSLAQNPDVAGVLLSMHGAMAVENTTDAEGAFVEFVRGLVGPNIPIAMPLDLHGNITRKMLDNVTFITSYMTNPHRDHFAVGLKATKILVETVLGKVKPTMAYRKMKLLKGGGYGIDFLWPMRGIFRKMKHMESQRDVLSVSNFMVHIWLDDPELGWTTIAVTDNNLEKAEKLAEELAELNWAVRRKKHPAPLSIDSAVLAFHDREMSETNLVKGPSFIADLSDAVSAGAPGENTYLIRRLPLKLPKELIYTSIADAEAVDKVYYVPEGDFTTVVLGYKKEKVYNKPYYFEGTVIRKHFTEYTGRIVLLRIKNSETYIVVTEHPNPVFYPSFYEMMGLSIWKAKIVVVKNIFPFRFNFLKYNRQTLNVFSPGCTNLDVFGLKYEHIPRPIFPLDDVPDWR